MRLRARVVVTPAGPVQTKISAVVPGRKAEVLRVRVGVERVEEGAVVGEVGEDPRR